MKITDDVIVKFFGNGKGFTMTSIKRWGGFIKHEDELECAQFHALKSAISAKNREIEFEDEVHMVNYMMRTCYWGWCIAVKERLRLPLLLESQLIPEGSDDDWQSPLKREEPVPPKEFILNPHRLHLIAMNLVIDQLGELSGQIFELHYIKEMEIKLIAKTLGISNERVRSRLSTIDRLLARRLKTLANQEYKIGKFKTFH